jgi:hypothetical protein
MITNVNQRWCRQRPRLIPSNGVINPRLFEVAPIPDDVTARDFVTTQHYSGSYPAARFRYGLYTAGALVGVAVYSVPSNPLALRPLPGEVAQNVELGRFVLLNSVRGNGESYFLARTFEHLRREHITGIVSFSDPMPRSDTEGRRIFPGHVGTIYQATNAVFLGRSRKDTLRLLPDGKVLHNRALAKVRARVRGWQYVVQQLLCYGATAPSLSETLSDWLAIWVPRLTRSIRHPGNLKYAWSLDRRMRKALPASQPYLKLDDLVSVEN